MRRVASRVLIRPGRTPFFVGVAALVLLTSRLTLLPPPAHAVVTCTSSGTTVTINLSDSGDQVVISQNGTGILVSGTGLATPTNCGAPAVSTVNVTGVGGPQTVTIDLTNGTFPGVTFNVDLGTGGGDTLIVSGSAGADNIVMGGAGVVNLDAGTDNNADVFPTNVENFVIRGNGGNDTLSAAGGAGTGGPATVPVTIDGGAGNDTNTGGSADDTFVVHTGENATLDGGAGVNTIDFSQVLAAETFNLQLSSPIAQPTGGGGSVTLVFAGGLSTIQNIIVTPFNDTLIGDAQDNKIQGEDGSDQIFGLAGDDDLEGGNGADTIFGGEGDDQIDGGKGDDSLNGGEGDDTIHGGDGVDTIHGDDGNDKLFGDNGDDVVNGDAGDDEIHGGDGVDALHGDDGNDTIFG